MNEYRQTPESTCNLVLNFTYACRQYVLACQMYFKFLYHMSHTVCLTKFLTPLKRILTNKITDVYNKFLEIYMLCSYLYDIFVRVIHGAIFKVTIEYKLDPFHPLQNNCRYSDIYNYEYYSCY
jgi:hypothetical protein